MRRLVCIFILLVLLPQSVCSLVYPSAHRHSIHKVRHSTLSPSPRRHRQHKTISNHNKNIYRQHCRHRSVSYLTTKEDSSDDSIVSFCRLLQKCSYHMLSQSHNIIIMSYDPYIHFISTHYTIEAKVSITNTHHSSYTKI